MSELATAADGKPVYTFDNRFGLTLLSLVPVGLAIGASSVIIAVLGVDLSPLTTVSGPLVIATCTEFSVLILARYLEERQHRLDHQKGDERDDRYLDQTLDQLGDRAQREHPLGAADRRNLA